MTEPEIPAPAQMLDLITGYWVSRAIYCVSKLGISDLLAEGPRTAADLAKETQSTGPALYRLLRALASKGVYAEMEGQRFSLTPLGATLRRGAQGSMRNFALMIADDYNWDAWKDLGYSVRTGNIAFDKTFGMPIFDYLQKNPELARIFGDSMGDLSGVECPAVAASYDFSKIKTLVDVGGSHGVLLHEILKRNPQLRGILYDSEHVIANAQKDIHISAPDVAGRIRAIAGNFFESVPSGGDAYCMKYILHDWSDEKSLRILGNIRKVIPRDGVLLVFDTVVPTKGDNAWSKWLDINMLVLVGGKERTETEFRELLAKAGFRLEKVHPTPCPLSIVEARPA
jgi:hypothetical protein